MRYVCIKDFDIAQGPGIHVSLWTQGCIHKCTGCHNPETWDLEGGLDFTNKEIIKIIELLKYSDVHKDLSILGGEPLLKGNIDKLTVLLSTVKKECPDVKVWMWTGFTYEQVHNLSLMRNIDVLVDGRYEQQQHEITRYAGSRNQKVIDIPASRQYNKVVLFEGA